ncbi:layilin-like [Haliotis cracherodii]|uniref:layilin-like n=1 Tax=Haliotis cracherodii TaxID=6455 RepID=UPI0039E8688E
MLYTVVAGHKLTAKTNVNCYQWRHDECPSQWTYSKPTGLCLRLFSPSASNTDARQTCVENGGRLVKIQNFKENILIRDIMLENDGGLHIGLKKTPTGWQWHLGEALGAFNSWKNGHPKSGSCVVMSIVSRGWYTDSCANKRKYLCEIVLDNPYGDC